jgi:hypothetical protein
MTEKEIWKDVPGYEGLYQVSNLGRVKSLYRTITTKSGISKPIKEKIRKAPINCYGYKITTLSNNGKQKSYSVHQLIAIVFLGHIPSGNKLVVDHIDNNKLNNKLENLQIISNRENSSKDKKGYTSRYIGVRSIKDSKKWKSEISINKRSVYLGTYNCETKAYLEYCKKIKQITLKI